MSWKSVAFELCPRCSAVVRNEKTAAGATAFSRPRVHLELPHCGEERLRIRRTHHHVDAAGIWIDKQNSSPGLPAVGRSIDPALLLRSVAVSLSCDENDVRIFWIDRKSSDSSTLLQSHARPRAAGVGGLIDSIADRDMTAYERLARSCPDDVRIRRRDCERTDRRDILTVEDRRPVNAAIGGLPDSAGRRARVVHIRIAGNSGY